MRIKYADVPKMETLQKLISVSFDSPKKNLAVYKFCKFMQDKASYLENERAKLIDRYGFRDSENPTIVRIEPNTEAMEKFMKEWNAALDIELEEDIPPLALSENDFSNSSYSSSKEEWLSPKDLGAILRFCE